MDNTTLKISYFAFDIFNKSHTAGYVHTREMTNSLSKHVDLQLTLMPHKKDFINPFIWSNDKDNYSRFTLWLKPYLIPALPMNVLSWYKVYQRTKEFKPDIIHERFHSPNPFGMSIFKKLNTKTISSRNTLKDSSLSYNSKNIKRILEVNSPYVEDSPYHGILKKIIEKDRKIQFENCDAIITQTETLKNIISLSYESKNKRIYVVSNGVNTELFRPLSKNTLDRCSLSSNQQFKNIKNNLSYKNKNTKVVCFSGSFQKWHGVHLIPEIIKRMKNVWFLLIGEGKEFEKIKNMGLRRTVFLDSVPYEQLPYYLNMANIFIAPFDSGQFEYFDKYGMWWSPLKLYEYMAVGKPVVSFDYPEIRKIIGNHGLLAKVGDLDDFIDKLWMLVENKGVCELMGDSARQKAMEYDWDKKAMKTINIYRDILK